MTTKPGGTSAAAFYLSAFFGSKESGKKETAARARAEANSYRELTKAPNPALAGIGAELLDARPLKFAYAHSQWAGHF